MKKAFTLLELVFVIVVIGIIVTVMIPRSNSNRLQEVAIQLVSHIRYTQHLAMIDDNYDASDSNVLNPQWYRQRWQLMFQKDADETEGEYAYSIYLDDGTYKATASNVKPDFDEFAMDPMNNKKYLSGGSTSLHTSDSKANKKMNIGLSYGIDDYELSGGCRSSRLTFDYLGRPMSGSVGDYTTPYKIATTTASPKLISTTCIITLISAEGSIAIHVEPETGYAHIVQL